MITLFVGIAIGATGFYFFNKVRDQAEDKIIGLLERKPRLK